MIQQWPDGCITLQSICPRTALLSAKALQQKYSMGNAALKTFLHLLQRHRRVCTEVQHFEGPSSREALICNIWTFSKPCHVSCKSQVASLMPKNAGFDGLHEITCPLEVMLTYPNGYGCPEQPD